MARGTLRVYLGAAPGVGKTYRMLDEGRRRAARGADVVIGLVETHGRRHTEEQIGDLELLPRRRIEHRGATFEEFDLQAALDRAPQVVLIDEFAHTNVPGAEHEKRWQDVDALLDHGIDVISTLNIQHLESLADVVAEVTGVVQRETIPDEIVRRAEQVELVDMAAQALRRRLAHGNVYAPDKIDAALAQYFREGNLLSLREMALLWTAGRVDEALRRYREQHGIEGPWETRERVVVAVDGGPSSSAVLRRAARLAERTRGELLAVHVTRSDGLRAPSSPEQLAATQQLAESLGGSFRVVVGSDVAAALVDVARSAGATQLVLGPSRRSRLGRLTSESVSARVASLAGAIDVHLVAGEGAAGRSAIPAVPSGLGVARRATGLLVGLVLLVTLTALLEQVVEPPELPIVFLLYLVSVLVAAWIGGIAPAAAVAVLSALTLNWFFTEPIGTLDVARTENISALLLFVAFGVLLGGAVEVASRRAAEASRYAAESTMLAQLAAGAMRGEATPARLMSQVLESFRLDRVELQERQESGQPWRQLSVVGEGLQTGDDDAARNASTVEIDDRHRIEVFGRRLDASDLRVLTAYGAHVGAALERGRLQTTARSAQELVETDRARTALLASVGHDLRTPLAGIKAAVSSLRQSDVAFTPDDQAELLAAIEQSTDRLTGLVGDLLDMTRLQSGSVATHRRAVLLDEVIGAVLGEQDPAGVVAVDVPEQLPAVDTDAALLERVLSNVIANALTHGGGDVRLRADRIGARVELRVIDRGPGVPAPRKGALFEPFLRAAGQTPDTPGLGLGLAVARGLAEATGATVEAEDTPGGGLTIVIGLPVARERNTVGDEEDEDV